MLLRPVSKAVVSTLSKTANLPVAQSLVEAAASTLAFRGGGPDVLNLGRAKVRFEAMNSYSVVLSLMLNASLRLFSATPKKLAHDGSIDDKAKLAFVSSVSTTVVTSAYAIIVFFLLTVYSKRALGLGYDAAFLEFAEQTDAIRESAFGAFLISLLTFKTSFLLTLFLNYEGKTRWWISSIVLAVDLVGWFVWSRLAVMARQILFTSALS
jgi:hypothetical protein